MSLFRLYIHTSFVAKTVCILIRSAVLHKKRTISKILLTGSTVNMMKVTWKIENKTNSREMEIEQCNSDLFMLVDFVPQ